MAGWCSQQRLIILISLLTLLSSSVSTPRSKWITLSDSWPIIDPSWWITQPWGRENWALTRTSEYQMEVFAKCSDAAQWATMWHCASPNTRLTSGIFHYSSIETLWQQPWVTASSCLCNPQWTEKICFLLNTTLLSKCAVMEFSAVCAFCATLCVLSDWWQKAGWCCDKQTISCSLQLYLSATLTTVAAVPCGLPGDKNI